MLPGNPTICTWDMLMNAADAHDASYSCSRYSFILPKGRACQFFVIPVWLGRVTVLNGLAELEAGFVGDATSMA